MLSVTQRIKQVSQPYGGYLPVSLLRVYSFDDQKQIDESDYLTDYSGLQGLTVDYLTRFMSGYPIEKAFEISFEGAEIVGQEAQAHRFARNIKGLDQNSIQNAISLVSYDVAYRRGPDFFVDPISIIPHPSMVSNICIMVNRGLGYLKNKGKLISVGFTFDGGYTKLISSGDGDFLTEEGLWDFKTSKNEPTSKETLQILAYYILGYHSNCPAFKSIKRIGLYNPFLNKSYEVILSEIPDFVFHGVSRNVLGYKISDNVELWRDSLGNDETIYKCALYELTAAFKTTGFKPENYDDGIYDISVDDYWTYLRDKTDTFLKPRFPWTKSIKFLKHDGFLMFISVSHNGNYCLLRGGSLRKLDKPLNYYYDNLASYGNSVLATFSAYWDAIFGLAEFISKVTGQEHARVHGCIVDIDFHNHVYLGSDGKLKFYYAPMMGAQVFYPDFHALISAQLPEMLPALQSAKVPACFNNNNALNGTRSLITLNYGADMYDFSGYMKGLQPVREHHLIALWDDALAPIQKEKLPYCQRVTDQVVSENLKQYVTLKYKKRNKTNNIWLWGTKKRIKQTELFAVFKKLTSDYFKETARFERITLVVQHDFKWRQEKEEVCCVLGDTELLLPRVLKRRQFYLLDIRIRLRISAESAIWALEISGGDESQLAITGNHVFEGDRLIPVSVKEQKTLLEKPATRGTS